VISFPDKGGSGSVTVLSGTRGSGSVGGTRVLRVGGISRSDSSHVAVDLGIRFQPLDSVSTIRFLSCG
jgi:hypothetical protein